MKGDYRSEGGLILEKRVRGGTTLKRDKNIFPLQLLTLAIVFPIFDRKHKKQCSQ